jgi:hypothetical protein
MDDQQRKRDNAAWAASQAYDTLGLIWRHEQHLKVLTKRFAGEPEFYAKLLDLGLVAEIEKRTGVTIIREIS